MAVRRIVPKKLDKASLPTEYETFTNAYFHEALKYRLWIGPTQPPADKTRTGDIWRQDSVNPHVFRQLMPNGTWTSMLAGTEYPASSGLLQPGFVTADDGVLLANATAIVGGDTLVRRGPTGEIGVGRVHIDAKYETETTAWSSIFTNSTTTKKNYITFQQDSESGPGVSNDPGKIVHETSGDIGDIDKGVLHLIPSDNGSGSDHVAIGRTGAITNYDASIRLFTDGRIYSVGQIQAVSFNSTSTIEAKENIYPTTISALDLINQTNIVDFNFKGFDEPKIGFIAEHTNSLLSGPEQNIMDHSNAIGLLLKAVQELSAEVEELKSRLGE